MSSEPSTAEQGEQPPPSGARRLLLSRTVSRVFIVLGVLGMVAAWRLDQAVSTAYSSGWVKPEERFLRRLTSAYGCDNCWRLPGAGWLWASAFVGTAALLCLLVAAILFQWRHRAPRDASDPSPPTPRGVRQVALFGGIGVAVLAVAAGVVRYLAASGWGTGWIVAESVLELFALGVIAIIVVAAAAGSSATTGGPYTLVGRTWRFLYRQRVNVIGVAFLAVATLFVAQSSGQAIDSIRTWSFGSAEAIARLGFGVLATLLLSLVVYESAVQLTQVSRRRRQIAATAIPAWLWLGFGGTLLIVGSLLIVTGPFGYGAMVIGAIATLLGLLELPNFERAPAPGQAARERATFVRMVTLLKLTEDEQAAQGHAGHHDERVAEILAVVPLLVFAATGVAAAIDAALSRGGLGSLAPLVPSAILAGAAVLMTAEKRPRDFDSPGWRPALLVVVGVTLATLLLVAFSAEVGAAILALAGCVVALAYTTWLFRIQPPAPGGADLCTVLSLPVAVAVGLAMLVAVHADTFGSTSTLGTLTLVSFGLAFWLAVLNFFIFRSFYLQPPSALRFIGIEQLPVVTLVAIAWIATGVVAPPPTLHEARLAERQPVVTDAGAEIPPTPTLSDVFAKWVDAQPELAETSVGDSNGPVPMFLVAAHGGGIRASYWTALALDCIVGVSSAGFERTTLQSNDDAAGRETCRTPRRSRSEQEAAARRILLVSGVSGGAVGLYAYARQLIAEGSLGDGKWIDERLGGDFASATVGWGLFHDVTNHWLGLHSARGGDCAWRLGSVCMTADRAAIHEQAFDRRWPEGRFAPLLRLAWDMRSATDAKARAVAETVPLVISNTTVTGGRARGIVSAANLGSWPNLDTEDPGGGNFDKLPLAGTVEVVEAACATKDIQLSTAALLASRFPYVAPSGHVSGRCRRSEGEPLGDDKGSPCANVKAALCEMRLVDGGYAENSGLFTIDALWPSLRRLVTEFNETSSRKIAPVIVELDNHYQARLAAELAASSRGDESIVPLLTAFGARNSMQTFARALAYRLRPTGCTVTVSPGLHPGLTAPLGWELSQGARDDLREGLTRPHPTEVRGRTYRAVRDLRRLQRWLGEEPEPASTTEPKLSTCVPSETRLQLR